MTLGLSAPLRLYSRRNRDNLILATSIMIHRNLPMTTITSFHVAEAREIILVMVTKRYHRVAVSPTEYAMVVFRVYSAFADRLGEEGL